MKKICVVTAARSEYGLLRWVMKDIESTVNLELQILVTGTHLSNEHGNTSQNIIDDGFVINEAVPMLLSSSDKKSIVTSMGLCQIGIANAFDKLNPDLIIVLGDRYELLPICSAALIMDIPIAHISGGDITEGAIDDSIRHSVTKMASIHFPGIEESANRIIQMGEERKNIHTVGEPGLDNFFRKERISKEELANQLHLDINKEWVLCTYHPETKSSLKKDESVVNAIIHLFADNKNIELIITSANADFGGTEINDLFKIASSSNSHYHFFTSLGQDRYTSFMNYCSLVIGNSSSGVVEAGTVKKAVINIGERQKGRPQACNVVNSNGSLISLQKSINLSQTSTFKEQLSEVKNPYGDGDTSKKIVKIISNLDINKIKTKRFIDVK